MKKEFHLTTLFFLLFLPAVAFGNFNWVNHDTSGIQFDDSYRVTTVATGIQTNPLLGTFSMAVGYDLNCVNSLTSHAQYQRTNLVPLTNQTVYYSRADRQSGWDSWEQGSVNQCNVNWKHIMSDDTGISLSGTGFGISFGAAQIAAAGTHIGFMIKPEEEELIVCNMDIESEGENICGDPILVDLNNDGFDLVPAEDGVLFDIDADGRSELTAWTRKQSDDVFLFLDLNDNDRVDDGSELFGDRTRLLSGEYAVNGYEALAELDLPEWDGNGDLTVNQKDGFFKLLGLWSDWNQNGISEPEEMIRLKDSKIKSLSLELEYFDVYDEHGNWIEYASWASTKLNTDNANQTLYRTADIYLRKLEITN